MAFLYGLLRALATGLRKLASGREAQLKTRYERAEEDFSRVESDCKSQEVELGRPVNFNAQLRLMKAYEAKEKSRDRWMHAAQRLANSTSREEWLKDLRGRKMPYSLGLVDMATVMFLFDQVGRLEPNVIDLWNQIASYWN